MSTLNLEKEVFKGLAALKSGISEIPVGRSHFISLKIIPHILRINPPWLTIKILGTFSAQLRHVTTVKNITVPSYVTIVIALFYCVCPLLALLLL